jgi:hypothetical protein
VYHAYVDHILNAEHFIYIENQFFVSSSVPPSGGTIHSPYVRCRSLALWDSRSFTRAVVAVLQVAIRRR